MSHTCVMPMIYLGEDLRLLLRGEAAVARGVTVLQEQDGCLRALAKSRQQGVDSGPQMLIVALPAEVGVSALPLGLTREVVAVLALGLDAAVESSAKAWLRRPVDGLFDPNVRILFPGRGMARIGAPGEPVPSLDAVQMERWSRSIAALGVDAVTALSSLSIGFVGAGRLGGAILDYFATLPLRRIVIVDPDAVQVHNLGESHFTEFEIGTAKAIAWQRHLAICRPDIMVEALVHSATDREAMDALATCDLIFSMPDNPGARLAASAIAAAYHIPLVDIGTRIHHEARADGEIMGADIRLTPPGRCLIDWGGVADQEIGRRIIASPDYERSFAASRDWRTERRGSLHSLNLAAVALAARMFEDFVAGNVSGPAWWHLGFAANGIPKVESLTPDKRPTTCACSLAGLGPRAYPRFGAVLRESTQKAH